MEKESFIKKWLRGELSANEQKEFDNSDEHKLLSKIDRSLQQFKAPDFDGDTSFIDNSNQRINRHKTAKRGIRAYLSAAAVLLVICSVAAYIVFNPGVGQVVVDSSSQKSIYLPDSSFVKLNTGSSIVYNLDSWQKDRFLKLTGEAFFRVSKGNEFKVYTKKGVVSVLGTQFNVIHRENYFEVTCFEGKVNVVSEKKSIDLVPGESFRIIGEEISQPAISTGNHNSPGWVNGESRFRSLPVKIVLKEFERQYNVTFNSEEIDINHLISGSFVHGDIELALENISIPLNCTYKIVQGRITLFAKHTP